MWKAEVGGGSATRRAFRVVPVGVHECMRFGRLWWISVRKIFSFHIPLARGMLGAKWHLVSPSESHWVRANPGDTKWSQRTTKRVQGSPRETNWVQVTPGDSKRVTSVWSWFQKTPRAPPQVLLASFSCLCRYGRTMHLRKRFACHPV